MRLTVDFNTAFLDQREDRGSAIANVISICVRHSRTPIGGPGFPTSLFLMRKGRRKIELRCCLEGRLCHRVPGHREGASGEG